MQITQIEFTSNYHRFVKAIDIQNLGEIYNNMRVFKSPDKSSFGLTVRDVFDAFEDASAQALKVNYFMNGERVRVDYTLTLSCFEIIRK